MKKASKKNLWQNIFWSKKNDIIATRVNLCFKEESSRKSMNFILLSRVSLIVAIVTTNSSTDKVPEEKACALRDKNALKKKKEESS